MYRPLKLCKQNVLATRWLVLNLNCKESDISSKLLVNSCPVFVFWCISKQLLPQRLFVVLVGPVEFVWGSESPAFYPNSLKSGKMLRNWRITHKSILQLITHHTCVCVKSEFPGKKNHHQFQVHKLLQFPISHLRPSHVAGFVIRVLLQGFARLPLSSDGILGVGRFDSPKNGLDELVVPIPIGR